MPEVTNPAEEYFKDGLWAWDATNSKWIKVVADPATGYLKVDMPDTIEVTQDTPANLQPGVNVWDGGTWRKAACTAGGYVKNWHTGQSVDVEVQQTTPTDMRTLAHGWDGSAARKLPMLYGYTSYWLERETTTNAAAGTNILDFSGVTAGQVWVLNAICAVNATHACGVISYYITLGGTTVNCFVKNAPAAAEYVYLTGWWVLPPGSVLHAYFTGCTAGDDLYADAVGFKMSITS